MMKYLIFIRNIKKPEKTRNEFLERMLDIDGIYIPKFYDVEYNADGTVKSITPNTRKQEK